MAALALLCALPLLGVWYFGATVYLVFHDQLLASLISRQADMQYSYEDRIAVLRSQLERETSRALIDRQTLTTTLSDLTSRGQRLEERAAAIDALVRETGPVIATPASRAPLDAPSAPDVRLDRPLDAPDREKRVDLSPEVPGGSLAAKYAKIERQQADDVARLRDPMLRVVQRLQTALLQAGLAPSRWRNASRSAGDVGGPFVPLNVDARPMTFEQNLALLQDAIAERRRLSALVDQVPLRQPLPGHLEMTSPFGARLDPFYGRAAMHTGMDLQASYGAEVRATAGGIVTIAATEGGYGRMVEIDHGNGLVTRYAHLSAIEVAVKERVTPGMVVGRVGSTGRSTGPHLHYETRIDGEAVDPAKFLKAGSILPPA